MGHVNLPVVRVECRRLVIDVARGLVHAIDVGDVVVAWGYLPEQLPVVVVHVDVVVAVAVGRHQDVVVANLEVDHGLLLHVLGHALFQEQVGHGAARVGGIEVEHVLMSRHGVDQHLVGVGSRHDARHVAVGVERHLQLLRPVALDVIAPG